MMHDGRPEEVGEGENEQSRVQEARPLEPLTDRHASMKKKSACLEDFTDFVS